MELTEYGDILKQYGYGAFTIGTQVYVISCSDPPGSYSFTHTIEQILKLSPKELEFELMTDTFCATLVK